MQFTPQQLAGSSRFTKALIGNWYEDRCHSQRPRPSGLLERRAKKAERCLHRAPISLLADGILRYGDAIQLQSLGAAVPDQALLQQQTQQTLPPPDQSSDVPRDGSGLPHHSASHDGVGADDGGKLWRERGGSFVLACDPFEETALGSREFLASVAAAGDSAVARATFRIVPVTDPKLQEPRGCGGGSGLAGATVRYGEAFLLACDAGLRLDDRLGLLRPPLFLCSAAKSETRATAISGRQAVFLRGGLPSAAAVWRLQKGVRGKDGALERISADGEPVRADEPLVVQHRATMAALCCQRRFTQTTDFGVELEVSCHNATTQGRMQQLGHERSGRRTGATAVKCELPSNRWIFRVAANAAEATETRQLPCEMDAVALLKMVVETVKACSGGDGGKAVSVRSLCRSFRLVSNGRAGRLDPEDFRGSLRNHGVELDDEQFGLLLHHFDHNGDGFMNLEELLRAIRGPINERRRAIVAEAFSYLDAAGSGKLTVEDLRGRYDAAASPAVREGRQTTRLAVAEFLSQWDTQQRDGVVTKAEFEQYYQDVSAAVEDDDAFELVVRNAWHMSGGSSPCQNSTCLHVLVTHGDGTQEVVEVRDDLGLKAGDTADIIRRLAGQGVRDVARVSVADAA